MATQITPDTRSSSNVWTRQAALRAPVKETIVETLIESTPETSESQVAPVNLAPAFEAKASDDTGFVTPSAEKHAANLARMNRQAERAAQPRAPRVVKPKEEAPQKKPYAPLSFAPFRTAPAPMQPTVESRMAAPTTAASIASALVSDAPMAAAAPAAAAEKLPNTYTVAFRGKVTAGLTYPRLLAQTKADLLKAQESVFNLFITAFENAMQNDGVLQCINHLAGGFQTRKFVDGTPITIGEHTFLVSDIIKEQFWVRKTRAVLNEIEPRLHVSFYFDQRTSKCVLAMRKA
jgi:hypothetical protein